MSFILDIHMQRNSTVFRLLKSGLMSSVTLDELKVPSPFSLHNKEEMIRVIHGFKEKNDIGGVRVYLPLYMCLFSIVDLPLRKKSDVRDALRFELGDALPLPIDEYAYDFRVIDKTKSSSKVLALCVKNDIVSGIISVIKETGLNTRSVRSGFMEKLSSVHSERKRSDFIFINFEKNDNDVAVVKDGVCVEIRRVSDVGSLQSEIESIRSSYQIKDVLVMGDVTDEIRTTIGVSAVSRQKEEGASFRDTSYTFDFFKLELSEDYRSNLRRYSYIAAAVSGIFIITGFFLPVYRDYSQLNNINSRIREIKDEASGLIEKRKQLDIDRKKLKFLSKRRVKSAMYLNVISELSTILPEDAWVMSLNADEKGFVELKGFADNASKLVEILESSNTFKNVGFSAPMIRSGEQTRFSVKMELEV